MFVISISFFAITTGIIGVLLNYCHNRLRDFEAELPRKISYHFGNSSRLSTADIITELKRRLTLNIQESESGKYTEWLKEYNSLIRDMLIVKTLLIGDIVLITIYAVYSMLQIKS
ncbi:MAG: hypothetical protein A2987_05335 [Omnitrophica bacterium RIFCSPLOWO2_01_FULL_45_10]|nr:MAG: hypothetical protein A2987_05335 [Omnitrophica bacterium RIFCSPLOWO2_01_FULL_45_10]